ncbi:MAG: hypothetical protein KA205_07065 [Acidobacteria bacterium]|nr:hypothetical protein [Acidobacteriota bacterium]
MPSRVRISLTLAAIALWMVAAPLIWRGALSAWGPAKENLPLSYLPAAEARRERLAFESKPIDELKTMDPVAVIIGDSMAGRVDPVRLGELLDNRQVATLVAPATGPGWWYLAFKNYVIPSGITPSWVFVFMRDTNLTDPMFRLLEPYRGKLDQVARDLEPELNEIVGTRLQGPWHRVHSATDQFYELGRARTWLEPKLAPWLARVAVGNRQKQRLLDGLNAAFGLEHLRPIPQADLDAADDRDADFNANINTSLMPSWVELARANNLRVVFIKVLRRPTDQGLPPPESPALQQYTKDLRAWIEANGMVFFDDRDNPAMAKLPYADGDHVDGEGMTPYAELLAAQLERIKK